MTQAAAAIGQRSRTLRVYLQVVVAIGTLAFAGAAFEAARTPQPLAWMSLAALALVSAWLRLSFKTISATVGIDDTFCITAALLFGPGPATVALVGHSLVYSIRRRRPASQLAFNAAALALSMWTAARAFFALAGVAPLAMGDAPITGLVAPLLAMVVVYFVLNSGLTAVAVGLDTDQAPIDVWKHNFRWLWVGYIGAASTAFCLILLLQQRSFLAAAMVLPLLAILHLTLRATFGRLEDAKRHLGEMDRLYLSTVETLAMAIDAKDDVTHSHVRRVQAYAVGLARALGVADAMTVRAIEAAALLHDTGKLAVPEHILNKPGKLTEAEFERMKQHVDVGADILSLVEFPYPVVPIVRAHHESWDGSGYPRGLSGEEIPIGARILSVVDCFDALTSDRPYRRRMTDAAAIEILLERRGRMYDPQAVDAFIRVYKDIDVAGADMTEHREVLQRITQSHHDTAPAADRHDAASDDAPASISLLAFVSLSRVASGEATVADVLALGSRLVGDVMPGATGAWFFPEPGADRVVAIDAFGPAAHGVRGCAVGVGDRLTGWVAANRQPIVNSAANLDLGPRVEASEPPLRTCLSIPLLNGDALVAVLSLYSPESDAFDEVTSRLIQMVAPHLAASIHSATTRAAAADFPTPADKASVQPLRLVSTR
jgi:putative nucleotidyltransferase with HDIG domain